VVDHVVDVVNVDLAGAVAGDGRLDALEELRELGLVVGGDALAGRAPLGLRRVVHGAIVVRASRTIQTWTRR
jgi:hypothetical protein